MPLDLITPQKHEPRILLNQCDKQTHQNRERDPEYDELARRPLRFLLRWPMFQHDVSELHRGDLSRFLVGERAVFDAIEASAAFDALSGPGASFDVGDPFADIYLRIFSRLKADRRIACVASLTKAAVRLHRYKLMGAVRALYGRETNDTVKAVMCRMIDELDPAHVIEGRGVIPGRSP